jgi:hypothetical protein
VHPRIATMNGLFALTHHLTAPVICLSRVAPACTVLEVCADARASENDWYFQQLVSNFEIR